VNVLTTRMELVCARYIEKRAERKVDWYRPGCGAEMRNKPAIMV
jgi:hypothetical protein